WRGPASIRSTGRRSANASPIGRHLRRSRLVSTRNHTRAFRHGACRERASMGALVAIAAGLLGGAWAAVAGLRAPAMWVGALAVLGLALLVTVSVRNAGVRPGKRAWAPFALSGAVV